jgi:peptidoglycan/LPS O-acetylase OafA/YrhL
MNINLRQDQNNFDGVRLILALIVVFAHIAALTNLAEFNIFKNIFNADFAVKGFFAISGFLVIKSYESSSSLLEFFEKRIRRIYPAYVCTVFLCLIIGVCTSTLDIADFIKSDQTVKYVITNLLFLNFLQPTLPATFEGNPIQALNGSLWTIKVEVSLYFLIPFIFAIYKKFNAALAAALITIMSISWAYFFDKYVGGDIGPQMSRQFPGQLSYFVLGALAAVNMNAFKYQSYFLVLSAFLFALAKSSELRVIFEPFFYSSLVIYLSTRALPNLNLGRFGDISYGVYLYHFPIIQLLIHFKVFDISIYFGLIATFILTFVASICSWHYVEKVFLKRSSHYLKVT